QSQQPFTTAQQCHPLVSIIATYQCPSVPPISAQQCHPLVLPSSCAHQCPAVPPISHAYQCLLSVPIIVAYQCCIISASSSMPTSAASSVPPYKCSLSVPI
ncbi:unnamed protein product, partial [Staurois parvus]